MTLAEMIIVHTMLQHLNHDAGVYTADSETKQSVAALMLMPQKQREVFYYMYHDFETPFTIYEESGVEGLAMLATDPHNRYNMVLQEMERLTA